MKHVPALTAWLLLGAVANAAQPKSVISGITQTSTPGMITLDPTGSVSDVTKPIWIWSPNTLASIEDVGGKLHFISFSATPISGEATLVTLGFDTDGKTVLKDQMTVPISFGGTNPPTPPIPPTPPTPIPPLPPVPPTPPAPNLPDLQFKLAAIAYNAGMALPQSSRSKAAAVSACFNAAINDLLAGKYPDNLGGQTACGKATKDAVHAAAPDWDPAWTAIANAFNQLYVGSINTNAEEAEAFKEISLGFSQVQ